jgi:hypothetical protein
MATNDELYLTPYQQIMAQMTPTTNPYLGENVAIGGYDPALFSPRVGSGLINLGVGGGGGGGGGSGGSGGSEPAAPSAWSPMTPAQQAAYYAANPTMAGITQLGQKGFGFTSLGMLQNLFNPGLISEQGLIAMGINPAAYQAAKEGFRATEISEMNAAAEQAAAEAAAAEATVANDIDAASATEGFSVGGGDSGYSGGTTGAGNEGGGIGAGEGLAQGGKVTKRHLKGPDPKGPDEGYGALLSGEYVIKKSAVNKYGTGLLDMINDGKIPAKKMKSLLG